MLIFNNKYKHLITKQQILNGIVSQFLQKY